MPNLAFLMSFILIFLLSQSFCLIDYFSPKQDCIIEYILFYKNIQTETVQMKIWGKWRIRRKIYKEVIKDIKISKEDLVNFKDLAYANKCFKNNKKLFEENCFKRNKNVLSLNKLYKCSVHYLILPEDYRKNLGM